MKNLTEIKGAARRVDEMARLRGLDIEEQVLNHRMEFDEIADAVLRCQDCSNPGHCESWMQTHASGSERGPEYCRNTELFARLVSDQE